MKLGEKQTLTISRFKEFGAYLTDDGSDSVLLPKKEVPQGAKEGDSVEVFLYKDSQDRLIARPVRSARFWTGDCRRTFFCRSANRRSG